MIARKVKKGYASTVIALFSALLLAATMAMVLSVSSFEQASFSVHKARKAVNHFENAILFFNHSLDDAVLDAAWNATGCGNAGDFASELRKRVSDYFNASNKELNESIESSYSISVVSVIWLTPEPGFDNSSNVFVQTVFKAKLGDAFKQEPILLQKRVDLNYSNTTWPWLCSINGSVVQVNC